MRMTWRVGLFLLPFYLFTSLPLSAQSWPKAQQEAKAGTRWWWLGSAIDKQNLQWTMQQYADHGIGAVEITPLYGVQGNQANNIPYLSDQWLEMLREVQKNGKEMGIEVDMATGTGYWHWLAIRRAVGTLGGKCLQGRLRGQTVYR